ncbi:hypothetical protein FGL86_09400 [Pistricoccus aurantiacus]|uniref:Hemerythrin-like domain-containing protein n=1 Tax=Pistricoccus aurantiacus TaxID=1883414 RepID=A0A5B8SRG2_9GAMM|nr:hemerythrin domain-containing protein [Pistricoccus aurantiacus]QEA39266.1 hypothetical protein FGL86_09400 [Pistricoccus aurantiacus]
MSTSLLRYLQGDHQRYDGLLCIAERQLHGARCGDTPDFALLRDIFHYLAHHPDRLHHAFEDRLFERLGERFPEDRPYLDTLQDQHRRIATYGGELYAKFRSIAAGEVDPELDLNTMNLVQAYSELYHAHLRCEETRIFPHLVKWLEDKDWQEMMASILQDTPIADAEEAVEFEALRERIAANRTGLWLSDEERASFCPLCSA